MDIDGLPVSIELERSTAVPPVKELLSYLDVPTGQIDVSH